MFFRWFEIICHYYYYLFGRNVRHHFSFWERETSEHERETERGRPWLFLRDMFFFRLSKEHISTRQNIRWNGECSWGRNARHFIWFREEEAGLRGREWMLYRSYQEIPLTLSVGTAGGPAWRNQWQAASHSWRPSCEPRPASVSLSLSLFAPLPFLLCIRLWAPKVLENVGPGNNNSRRGFSLGLSWMPAHRAPPPSDGQLQAWQGPLKHCHARLLSD